MDELNAAVAKALFTVHGARRYSTKAKVPAATGARSTTAEYRQKQRKSHFRIRRSPGEDFDQVHAPE